jgi:hypothetical protein
MQYERPNTMEAAIGLLTQAGGLLMFLRVAQTFWCE